MSQAQTECNSIRTRLRDYHLTNVWLVCELEKRGVVVTQEHLCNIFSGKCVHGLADKVKTISLLILDRYERTYLQT